MVVLEGDRVKITSTEDNHFKVGQIVTILHEGTCNGDKVYEAISECGLRQGIRQKDFILVSNSKGKDVNYVVVDEFKDKNK